MLSEFIQLKLIKSHPNLQRAIPQQKQNIKFSLQQSRNTPFGQVQDPQQLIPKKFTKNLNPVESKQFSRNGSKSSLKITNNPVLQTNEYFAPRERSINHERNFTQPFNIGNKVPLIVSPKKQHSLSKEGLNRRSPLISSSKNKFLNHASQQNNSLQKVGLRYSSPFRYSLTKQPLIKSMQQTIFCRNSSSKAQDEQFGSKRYLLKSTSHQNLSPLKQKLLKITDKSKNENFNGEQINLLSAKQNLERSDSFKRAIEQSRQKKKFIDAEKENKKCLLNTEYYVGGNVKLAQSNSKNCRNRLSQVEKVIKNPSRKSKCALQPSKTPNIESHIPLRKKVDSFVTENVNNSNMFALQGQNSSILTMEPY